MAFNPWTVSELTAAAEQTVACDFWLSELTKKHQQLREQIERDALAAHAVAKVPQAEPPDGQPQYLGSGRVTDKQVEAS